MAIATPGSIEITKPLRQQFEKSDSATKIEFQHPRDIERKTKTVKKQRWYTLAQRVKSSERMLLLDNLGTMLGAGLGITDSLAILSEEMKNRFMKQMLINIRHGIEVGKTFSDGLEQYPLVFSPLLTATIRVGELSGTLVEVLKRLAEMARRENRMKRKILGALMYPAVVIIAMIIVSVVMLTYVFPQIISVFVESNIKLPLQIIVINKVGQILTSYGSLILGGIIFFMLIVYLLLKVHNIRRFIDRLTLRIPMVGKQIIQGSIIARITENLRTLLVSGLPIVDGMKVIAGTIKNLEYREELFEVAREIEVGKSIHESFAAREHLFPAIVVRMVKVGEGTGKLDDILQKLSVYYEDKVDDILGNISTLLEPVLLLLVGAGVGFIAVSIIGPIYEIANNF